MKPRRDQDPERADEDLLEKLRSGDTRALADVALRHWARAARVASLVARPAVAADLVTSAFLGLCDPDSVRPFEPLRLALYRHVIDGAISGASCGDGRLAVLHAAISSLEEVDRLAFVLRRIEQLPDADAAEILHLRPEELRRRAGRFEMELANRLWERRLGLGARRRGAA